MKPRILDLFSGAGGAGMGYHRAGFEVVGVDVAPQPNYPFEFHQADALAFPLQGFDAIHASPPCQAYSNLADRGRHPALVEHVRELLTAAGLPYIIENVVGAPLREPITLCGSSFGLGVERHRLFETTFAVMAMPCAHGQQPKKYRVYQRGQWYMSRVAHVWGVGGGKAKEQWPEAMGIDWMTPRELAEAIPPAYTAFIGEQLMAVLATETAA